MRKLSELKAELEVLADASQIKGGSGSVRGIRIIKASVTIAPSIDEKRRQRPGGGISSQAPPYTGK